MHKGDFPEKEDCIDGTDPCRLVIQGGKKNSGKPHRRLNALAGLKGEQGFARQDVGYRKWAKDGSTLGTGILQVSNH